MITKPTGKMFGKSPYSTLRAGLTRGDTGPGERGLFWYLQQFGDVYSKVYDFDEITLNADPWTLTKDAGATHFAINTQASGVARGITGGSSGEGLSMLGSKILKGDLNCGIEMRAKLQASVANVTFEMALIDDVTDKTTPVVTDVDTPTFGAGLAEGVALTLDTGETNTKLTLSTKSATYTTAAKQLMVEDIRNPANTAGWAPTVDTFFTLRIALDTDEVYAMVFDASGNLVAHRAIIPSGTTGGIEGGTLLAPYVALATLAAASKNLDIDYIALWQDRF